jgi:queuine tRNA-ribosyltransferase
MIVCNTYHLYLRPGQGRVQEMGGLHRFSGWGGPILTDSGGYQVYSLASLTRVTDDGVEFHSHVDGSCHHFTPERVMEIQEALGADVAMCLDECPPYPADRPRAAQAVTRTTQWARRCRVAAPARRAVFGIVQGATYADLRVRSARELTELDFPGYAIGGLCLGEPADLTAEMVAAAVEELPPERPRYLMGAGYPADIVAAVAQGVDLFDCVLPTRNGRTGTAFTSTGRVAIRNACHASESAPLDQACDCYACRTFSRAYLRHLFIADEALGPRLLTLHNLRFFQRLMESIRDVLARGRFDAWRADFEARQRSPGVEDSNQGGT